jgi:predicted DNA-binding transcriptional regulator AlpA
MKADATLPGWPLLLRREWAAAYCGMSPSTFDNERKAGRVPEPISITAGLEAWHRGDLEAWAEDRRAGQSGANNPWDAL